MAPRNALTNADIPTLIEELFGRENAMADLAEFLRDKTDFRLLTAEEVQKLNAKQAAKSAKKERIGITALGKTRWNQLLEVCWAFDIEKAAACRVIMGLDTVSAADTRDPKAIPDAPDPKYFNTGFSVTAAEKADMEAEYADLPEYITADYDSIDDVKPKDLFNYRLMQFRAGPVWREVLNTHTESEESDD